MATKKHEDRLKNYLKSYKSGAHPKGDGSTLKTSHSSPNSSLDGPASRLAAGKGQRSPMTSGKKSSDVKSKKMPSSTTKQLPRQGSSKGYYRKPTLESIPDELLLKILQYLSASTIMTAGCVCKRWLKLTSDNVIWERLFISQTAKSKGDNQGHRLGSPVQGPPETRWRRQCIHWCKKRRNSRMVALLKKVNPYTMLPANTGKTIQKLGIKWQLVLTDNNREHAFLHSDVFCFPTTSTVRWYSLEAPPIKTLKRISIYALAPIFFRQDGNVEPGSACQRSLLLERKLNISQHAVEGCDDLVNLHIIDQGLLLATWKDGGDVAFFSLGIHNHMLLQRCCLGTYNRQYIPPSLKPKLDDVDTQYGLHDFMCIIELRHQRAVLWGQQFTNLHCKKEQIGDGFVHLTPVRPDVITDHSFTSKKFTLPWKTDVFKGIVPNFCILDVTLLDEFKSPMWVSSNPVKVMPADNVPVTYSYDGEPYRIYHTEKNGRVTIQLVTDENRFAVTGVMVDVTLDTINAWFGTEY